MFLFFTCPILKITKSPPEYDAIKILGGGYMRDNRNRDGRLYVHRLEKNVPEIAREYSLSLYQLIP